MTKYNSYYSHLTFHPAVKFLSQMARIANPISLIIKRIGCVFRIWVDGFGMRFKDNLKFNLTDQPSEVVRV